MLPLRQPWRKLVYGAAASAGRWPSRSLSLSRELQSGQQATRVLSFGDGSHGALGHGCPPFTDAYEPEEVEGLPNNITSLGAGHYHSLAVTFDGQVWSWGRNAEGQLGPRESLQAEAEASWGLPKPVKGLEGFRAVSATGSGVVSAVIDENGSLKVWGSSKRGQLGMGPGMVRVSTPYRVGGLLLKKRVKQVALGWGHAVACTADGEVYSWGYAEHGRLGYEVQRQINITGAVETDGKEDTSSSSADRVAEAEEFVTRMMEEEKHAPLVWIPQKMETLAEKRVLRVACGMDHTILLTDMGEVYVCGDTPLASADLRSTQVPEVSSFGALALPSRLPIREIAAGVGSSFVVQEEGCVLTWGFPSLPGLGMDQILPKAFLMDAGEIVKVVAGRVHACALTAKGELFTWGSGRNGRLGLSSSRSEEEPQVVEALLGERVLDVTCGLDHTLVLVENS